MLFCLRVLGQRESTMESGYELRVEVTRGIELYSSRNKMSRLACMFKIKMH